MADSKSKTDDHGGEPIAGIPYTMISCTMPYIRDSRDRASVSLVCKKWCELEGLTRKSVTVAMCYAVTPQRLRRRFPLLESLTVKGKPRAAMFGLVPEDWGGGVTPWVEEIAAGSMNCLNSVHFRRMIVRDSDLRTLGEFLGERLRELKLDWCSGFSTDGLSHVGKLCSNLKVLYMQDCTVVERDGEWLRELAARNSCLEVLNFYASDLVKFRFEDLEVLAENCRHSLVSVKISDYELLDLVGFFNKAVNLQEFGGGSFNCNEFEKYNSMLKYPPGIKMLAPDYLGRNEMPVVLPFAAQLTKLDLLYALIDSDDHCFLIQRCPNLEILLARDAIGDRGLQVVGHCCKKMRRINIERGGDEEGFVSHKGLIALAKGCLELESLYVYVTDIMNEALECVGAYLKKLYDFRVILLEKGGTGTDFPLDNGVRSLLLGCPGIRRLCLYLRTGALTDMGMCYIGQYGLNIRYLLLGSPGDSDAGLLEMSKGLPKVEKVDMRGCRFSERGLAQFVLNMPRLKYLWVDGYMVSDTGRDILAMARPFWNMELLTSRQKLVTNASGRTVVVEEPLALLAYFSLAGQRTDFPPYVIPLHPTMAYD